MIEWLKQQQTTVVENIITKNTEQNNHSLKYDYILINLYLILIFCLVKISFLQPTVLWIV